MVPLQNQQWTIPLHSRSIWIASCWQTTQKIFSPPHTESNPNRRNANNSVPVETTRKPTWISNVERTTEWTNQVETSHQQRWYGETPVRKKQTPPTINGEIKHTTNPIILPEGIIRIRNIWHYKQDTQWRDNKRPRPVSTSSQSMASTIYTYQRRTGTLCTGRRIHIPIRAPASIQIGEGEDILVTFWNPLHVLEMHGKGRQDLRLPLDDDALSLCIQICKQQVVSMTWCDARKKEGVRQIHQLRIIGLVEADFNTALKIFFAKQMVTNSERTTLT